MLTIPLPGPHLLVLVGAAGAGKSTWARERFLPTQVVSTDRCRALVGDREEVQAYSPQAFELFYFLIEKRLELNKTTVADSTGLDPTVRRKLLDLAHRHACPVVAVVFTTGLDIRRKRNEQRERRVPDDVLVKQQEALETAVQSIRTEDWENVYMLDPEEAERVAVESEALPVYSSTPPPYDIVGDIHGCYPELIELLQKLGWEREGESYAHPEGRHLVSLGDLADRGPDVPACFELFARMVDDGRALFIPGNHDNKLMRYLLGRNVRIARGLETSIEQLDALPAEERTRLRNVIVRLIESAPPYLILDHGRLVVAHGGIKKEMIGKVSREIIRFTLYGDTTGLTTPDGMPERRDWAAEYRGGALVVYGHTPVRKPIIRHNTVNIDQGCVFGGSLTALRYPEMDFVQVRAHAKYQVRKADQHRKGSD